jgi:hypothetical protein
MSGPPYNGTSNIPARDLRVFNNAHPLQRPVCVHLLNLFSCNDLLEIIPLQRRIGLAHISGDNVSFKGTVSRDFLPSVFFVNKHLPSLLGVS